MFEKVRDILSDVLELDPERIESDSLLEDDLGIDSLDVIELSIEIESEFDILIEDREAELLNTVGDLCTLIESKLSPENED